MQKPTKFRGLKILAVGPHSDDLELGCYGTLASLAKNNEVRLLVLSDGRNNGDPAIRYHESEAAAQLIGAKFDCLNMPDGNIRDDLGTIRAIEHHVAIFTPDIVFTVYPDDTHQDHRYSSVAVISAAREAPNLLFYGSVSSMHFSPDIFVDITDTIDTKLQAIYIHQSQFKKGSLDEAIRGIARNYGVLLRRNERFYEGFKAARVIL